MIVIISYDRMNDSKDYDWIKLWWKIWKKNLGEGWGVNYDFKGI